jgi:hypothetical protein
VKFSHNIETSERKVKYGWVESNGMSNLMNVMTTHAISPIIWRNGERLKKNFVSCDWLALDFDDHVSLQDMISRLAQFAHVIATTRNHQRAKKGIIADRFRVFIPFSVSITSREHYEQNMRIYARKVKSDPSCSDGARFFFPCLDIVSFKLDGKRAKVYDYTEDQPQNTARHNHTRINIPKYIRDFIIWGITFGSGRNSSFYSSARKLTEMGFSEKEVINLLKDANIDRTDWKQGEELIAIQQGIKG